MMIMKNINDRNSCPMAGEVESLLNTVRPSSVHLEELLKRYTDTEGFLHILYSVLGGLRKVR